MANNYFGLTLDTLAPKGSISRSAVQEYLNTASGQDYEINFGDASYMKVWTDTKATGVAEDAKDLAWVNAAKSYKMEFDGENVYYGHLILVDSVGNESEVYTTAPISYDPNRPVIESVELWDTDAADEDLKTQYTNAQVVGFKVTIANPGLASVIKFNISGNLDAAQETELALDPYLAGSNLVYAGTIKLAEGDGKKTVSVVATDLAGNTSDAAEDSIYLDMTADVVTIVVDGITTGDWVKGSTFTARLAGDGCESLVGYKIWEGDVEPSGFTAYTPESFEAFELTADGTYTISAIVKDKAGSVYSASNTVVINVDNKEPIVSIDAETAFNKHFSTVSGFDAINLTYSVDDEGKAPITSYEIKVDGVALDANRGTGAGTATAATLALAASDIPGADGKHIITITATDKAGNVGTASVEVTRDTTMPAGEMVAPSGWYTNARPIEVKLNGVSDALAGIASMILWVNAADAPAEAPAEAVTGTSMTFDMEKFYGTWVEGENTVKVKLTDNVGNVSVLTGTLQYDTVDPTVSIAVDKEIYNQKNVVITVTAADETSGLHKVVVNGNVTNAGVDNQWNGAATMQITTTFEGADGVKTITVDAYDIAGNKTTSNTITVELDETAPSISAQLYTKGETTVLPETIPVREFDLGVTAADDKDATANTAVAPTILVYGNIVGHAGKESAARYTYAVTEGRQMMIISDLVFTEGDGEKKIYVVAIDNAGNETAHTEIIRTFDGTAPEIATLANDFDRISKVHVLRRSAATVEMTDKYADEVTVTFTPSENISAYKVYAYNSQTKTKAALEGKDYYDVTGLNSMAEVSFKVHGADYEAALGGAGNDGVHAIVITIWNIAGTPCEDIEITL